MVPTPILDLQQDPPKPIRRWWIWAVAIVIWSIAGPFLGSFVHLPPLDGRLFFPVLYAGIALHEAGHLVAGRLGGMRPGGIAIGGFLFHKSGRNWVYRFDYRRILSGGIAKPLPPKGEIRVAPFAWMVAGGPLTNAALAGASAVWMGYAGESALAGTCFWMNILLVVFSAWPYSVDANKSDGARILLLLRRPAEARAWIALLMILTEEASGALPREWDGELCDLALAPAPGAPESSYVELLAYYRSLDRGADEEALGHLESCLARSAKSGKLLRHCFFIEASCASAGLRKSVANARAWLERARKLRKPESTDGIEAAIALCEERYDDVFQRTAAVRAYLDKRRLDGGLARFLRERLELFDRKSVEAIGGGVVCEERAGAKSSWAATD